METSRRFSLYGWCYECASSMSMVLVDEWYFLVEMKTILVGQNDNIITLSQLCFRLSSVVVSFIVDEKIEQTFFEVTGLCFVFPFPLSGTSLQTVFWTWFSFLLLCHAYTAKCNFGNESVVVHGSVKEGMIQTQDKGQVKGDKGLDIILIEEVCSCEFSGKESGCHVFWY